MERITPPLVRNYPPLTLYLDDLEEIDEILKGAQRLEFSSAEYKAGMLAELAEKYKGQRLRSFHISVVDPGVQIYLERAMARLYCVSGDTNSSGIPQSGQYIE